MNNAAKNRRGAKNGGGKTTVRRSSRLSEPASSTVQPSSVANIAVDETNSMFPSTAGKGRRSKRKATSSTASAASTAAAAASSSRQATQEVQVAAPPLPPSKRTSKRRKSTSYTTSTNTSTRKPAATATKKARGRRAGQQKKKKQAYVTPSPVAGPFPATVCPTHKTSGGGGGAPPSAAGSDHSPIEGASVKEALRVESEHGDANDNDDVDSVYSSSPHRSEEQEMQTPTTNKQDNDDNDDNAYLFPPEGVVDIDVLAEQYQALRLNPHPYYPAEPYYTETTTSYLVQYGREYYHHLFAHSARRHRTLTFADGTADSSGSNASTPVMGNTNDVVITFANVASRRSKASTLVGRDNGINGDSNRLPQCLSRQSEISIVMRGILVDWLAELKHSFKLNDITLHLSVKLLDRTLCHLDLERKMFQCLGCACMLIASKLEETQPVTIKDLAYMTDGTYTSDEIKEMEAKVCDLTEFRLQTPTSCQFIDRFLRASDATAGLSSPSPRNPIMEQMVNYLLELSLMETKFIETPCCMMAAAAVYLARAMLGIRDVDGNIWNKTLTYYTSYSVRDLENTVLALNESHRDTTDPDRDLQCCIEPYRRKERFFVARKPAPQLCDLGF